MTRREFLLSSGCSLLFPGGKPSQRQRMKQEGGSLGRQLLRPPGCGAEPKRSPSGAQEEPAERPADAVR